MGASLLALAKSIYYSKHSATLAKFRLPQNPLTPGVMAVN